MHRPGPSPGSEHEHRLASEPQRLERLVVVQPNTIAVVLASGQPPQIRGPGEQLRPNLLVGRRPTYVVVVSTAPTRLDLRLEHLQVGNREQPIELVIVRVGVQVSGEDDYARLLRATLVNYTDLDAYLVECVKRELADKVRRAMDYNAPADLEPGTMERALLDYGMPTSFADGVLERTTFSVLEVAGRRSETPRPLKAVPAPPTDRSDDTEPTVVLPSASALELNMDVGLRRLWRQHADTELLGIAGAQVGGRTSVLAVPVEEPTAYAEARLREEFSRHYADRHLRLLCAVATTYDGIVRAWFREVGGWPRRVVAITETEADVTLQVQIGTTSLVDQGRLTPEERRDGVRVGQESDREALRRLLPYEWVKFVAADTE